MDFLKKNYEKLLLGVVLLGLVGALASLPFFISSQNSELAGLNEKLRPVVKPLTNLNLTASEEALKRAGTPPTIDLGPPNRLFNPMPWQKAADERLIPISKIGPTALIVTNIEELRLKLSLESVTPPDASGNCSYIIAMEKPAATGTAKTKASFSCTARSKNKFFSVMEVKGKPEDPSEIVVQMEDTKETAVIGKNKPYERIEGYTADLRYDPEKKKWDNCRVNARPYPTFNGEEYNIVAINKDEVVLSAKSNGKKWTIKASAGS
ncbi:MAG TPA: hypothetical protein VJA21_19755 [Verrucomicrobiae bacterium]